MKTPKTTADYKKVDFEVPVQDIHPLDQIEFHMQSSKMLYSTMTTKEMNVQKLHNALKNIRDHLRVEKASSYAKDTIIKSLEELVIEVSYDPSNVKAVEELVKKKNFDIEEPIKQLKLSLI